MRKEKTKNRDTQKKTCHDRAASAKAEAGPVTAVVRLFASPDNPYISTWNADEIASANQYSVKRRPRVRLSGDPRFMFFPVLHFTNHKSRITFHCSLLSDSDRLRRAPRGIILHAPYSALKKQEKISGSVRIGAAALLCCLSVGSCHTAKKSRRYLIVNVFSTVPL